VSSGGFTPLQAVAGAGYVAHFLKYFCSPHEDASKLMRVVLTWTQFQTGLPFPILFRPSTDTSYVNNWYFHSVMHHLNEIGGTISHVPTYTLLALQDHDRSLMEATLHSGLFNTNQLKHINCVCMYLGNTYLMKPMDNVLNFSSMAQDKATAIHPSSSASSPANCLPAMTRNVMG